MRRCANGAEGPLYVVIQPVRQPYCWCKQLLISAAEQLFRPPSVGGTACLRVYLPSSISSSIWPSVSRHALPATDLRCCALAQVYREGARGVLHQPRAGPAAGGAAGQGVGRRACCGLRVTALIGSTYMYACTCCGAWRCGGSWLSALLAVPCCRDRPISNAVTYSDMCERASPAAGGTRWYAWAAAAKSCASSPTPCSCKPAASSRAAAAY
jgi:hypothetical protein